MAITHKKCNSCMEIKPVSEFRKLEHKKRRYKEYCVTCEGNPVRKGKKKESKKYEKFVICGVQFY